MIRIISGRFRGKRIKAPTNLPVRPTTDRAKESLFNILNNHFYFEDISALDLFSGTGNISFELISRGCTDVTAVDSNPGSIKFITRIADEMKLEGLRIIKGDAKQYLSREYKSYDLIFADPPYEYEDYESIVEQVFLKNLLNEDGLLVIEHQSKKNFENLPDFIEVRPYGNAAFSFFGKPQKEDSE